MKKYTIIYAILFFIFALLVLPVKTSNLYAGENEPEKPFMKEIEKMRLKNKNGIFNLNLDVQLGIDIANTNFNLNKVDSTTNSLSSTSSKIGPAVGVIFSIDFLGFGFTSGFLYSSKGFQKLDGNNFNLNFFNIPLLFYFEFGAGKVLIDGNVGPYFGFLLSTDSSPIYSVKKFDFGLTGNLEGAYMINRFFGPMLGVKYEYGGLNNLGSNESIKSIRTSSFFIYTGVKFIL